MKETILAAAIDVIAQHGLANWTVEEVANKSQCAKGLINYHYRSKQELLLLAAETIRADRAARRLAAVQARGSTALDRLWTELVREVDSGWFGAWLGLLSGADPLLRAAAEQENDTKALVEALGRALELGTQLNSQAPLIRATLNGLQLQLLQGAPVAATEEAYHRFWLTVVT